MINKKELKRKIIITRGYLKGHYYQGWVGGVINGAISVWLWYEKQFIFLIILWLIIWLWGLDLAEESSVKENGHKP